MPASMGRARSGQARTRPGLRHLRVADKGARPAHRPDAVFLFGGAPSGSAGDAPPGSLDAATMTPRGHRRGRPAPLRARLHGLERRQHQPASRRGAIVDDADERVQGIHVHGHYVHHRFDRKKIAGDRNPSSEMERISRSTASAPKVQAVVHAHPPIATGFAVAGIPLGSRRSRAGRDDARACRLRQYATPSTRELPEAVRKYAESARWDAPRQPRRSDDGR